jgi:hypothetical protein
MPRREYSIAGILLLLFFGMRMVPPSAQPARTDTAGKKAEPAKNPPSADDKNYEPVWATLCKLSPTYGTEVEEGKSNAPSPACLDDRIVIYPILASVADPERTHLGMETDRTLEAITAAAAEAEYTPYVQDLPWANKTAGNVATTVAGVGNPGATAANTNPASPRQRYPGLLVFRRASPKTDSVLSGKAPDYLALFLITETPTSGLDPEQFHAVLRIIDQLPNRASPHDTLLMLGPGFSGSVASLEDVAGHLVKMRPEIGPPQYSVRCIAASSGTVTNAKLNVEQAGCSSLLNIQTQDQKALTEFTAAVKNMGYAGDQIALISEEGTKYGNQDNVSSSTSGGRKKSQDTGQGGSLRLHFPRGISNLRNATDPAQSSSPATAPNGQPVLRLDWRDARPDAGDTPIFGGYQTPLSEETVLSELAETVKAENIKAVGILASDPWDVTYLIHWFKEATPDVRLFVRDLDLVYLRTPDVGSLAGVLAVNNFPLIPENQLWSSDAAHRERHILTFPSSSQEGQYNAFTELIEEAGIVTGSLRELECGLPHDAAATAKVPDCPLWLAAAGTTGFYPVRLLPGPEVSADSLHLHAIEVGRPPVSAIFLWSLLALVGLWHSLGLVRSQDWSLRATKTISRLVPAHLKWEFDFSDRNSGLTSVKIICHVLALFTISFTTMLAGSSFMFFYNSSYYHYSMPGSSIRIAFYPILAFLAMVVEAWLLIASGLSLAFAWELWRVGAAAPNGQGQGRGLQLPLSRAAREKRGVLFWMKCGFTLLILFLPLASIAVWAWEVFQDEPYNAFLHYRDLNLGSNLAPILPLILLALTVYLGLWVYLKRISSWEFGTVEMPKLEMDTVFPSDVSKEIDDISTAMFGFPPRPWGVVLLIVLGLAALAFRPWATLNMLESRSIGWLTVAWFFLALLVLWSNWFRFAFIWSKLRKILATLEQLPLRAAFSRLPASGLSVTGWSAGPFLPIPQAVERVRALDRLDPRAIPVKLHRRLLATARVVSSWLVVPQPVMKAAAGAEGFTTVAHHITSEQSGTSSDAPAQPEGQAYRDETRTISDAEWKKAFHETRSAMTELMEVLARYLKDYWDRGVVEIASPKSEEGSKAPTPPSPDRRFELAEDLIALRYYSYIRYVFAELRTLLVFVVTAYVLLFLALHFYAFRAGQAIDWSFIILFACLGTGIVMVLGQQDRDALLSRLLQTTPGELGKDFYLDLIKYGAIPVLTLVASQVPSLSNFILRWIQPSLEAFH